MGLSRSSGKGSIDRCPAIIPDSQKMEALLRKTLSGEIRGLLKDRLDHINHQYPRLRRAYRHAYGDPGLDRLRGEAALCTILGLYSASAALSDGLLRAFLEQRLSTSPSAGSGGTVSLGGNTAAMIGQARDEGILDANDAATLETAYATIARPGAQQDEALAAAATGFFLAVDRTVRRHFERAQAA